NRMLGIKRSPMILDQLRFLSRHGIRFHTQIVVCPGYNDGAVLAKTIRDLLSLGPHLLSIAVVPVGLTRFRTFPLEPVDRSKAAAICWAVSRISDRDALRHGKRRLFLADELFLKAGLPLPPRTYYEEYPQIENGVGLLRQLADSWKQAKKTARQKRPARPCPSTMGKKYLLLTSVSAYPYVQAIAREAERLGDIMAKVVPVKNRFFGESVTVAGLLAAREVIRTIRKETAVRRFSAVLLPAVMFNYRGFSLDGFSPKRLSKLAGVTIRPIRDIGELLSL
ncbi:MAG: DUF512 domain-containing protein, partial [Chitinispirillaceae bacterium]|nr:DUF512 domain-containing protein [Chitinispirillaceae bacterium]